LNTGPVDLSPADAERERALLAAKKHGEFLAEVARMEAPPADESWPRRADVINRPPPYPPADVEPSPWPQPPPRDEAAIVRQQTARRLLEQVVEQLLRAKPNGDLAALDDVQAQVRQLQDEALDEARAAFRESPELAALGEARAALARAEQAVARAAAGQAEAAARFQEAVSSGAETSDVHALLAGHVAAGKVAAHMAREAGERVRQATAAATTVWHDSLARAEDRARREADGVLDGVVRSLLKAFTKALPKLAPAMRVHASWMAGALWDNALALKPYGALAHAETATPSEEK
jgi:hypothetical protein